MIGFYCNFLKIDVEEFVRKEGFVSKEGFLSRGGLIPIRFCVYIGIMIIFLCPYGIDLNAKIRICVKKNPYFVSLVETLQFIDETLRFKSFG